MRWLLDTNVWIDAHAGRADASRVFAQVQGTDGAWLGFSSISKIEILGFSGLSATDDKALRELLDQFEEVPVFPAVVDEVIRLRRLHKMKTPDAIIAATALLQKAELVTRKIGDFKKVTGLAVRDTQSF